MECSMGGLNGKKRGCSSGSLFGMAESFEHYNTSSFAVVVEEAVVTFTV